MTIKKWMPKLEEIMKHKKYLVNRINRGKTEIKRLNSLAAQEKSVKVQMAIYKEVMRGESIISPLITEWNKLSVTKIARQLGIGYHLVRQQEGKLQDLIL